MNQVPRVLALPFPSQLLPAIWKVQNLTSQNGLNPGNEDVDEFAQNVAQGMSLLEIIPPLGSPAQTPNP